MPRWAIWALNLIVVAILYGIAQFFLFAGVSFTYGAIFGFAVCYILYKCWRQDYADEAKAHFTDLSEAESRQPSPQHSPDRIVERR